MMLGVSEWRCSCGLRVKVVAEGTGTEIVVSCPNCGKENTVTADHIISVENIKDEAL